MYTATPDSYLSTHHFHRQQTQDQSHTPAESLLNTPNNQTEHPGQPRPRPLQHAPAPAPNPNPETKHQATTPQPPHNYCPVTVAALAAGGAFREVVNVGARAWTTYGDAYDPGSPVTIVREVDPGVLSALRGRKVHVSPDVGVLDPVYVPNTGSKEPFGATPEQVRSVTAWIADNCHVVSADVSEIEPDPAHRATGEIAM
ncbi:arginase family protein [Streptomyces flaveolus]|uniref:arginase family protein n=1 Tax=Streptomyces flaveolus TaxID=67297 RepID=UPI00339E16DE